MIAFNKPEKNKYFVEMEQSFKCRWVWYVICINGVTILNSKGYANKAQCRNVGRRFANSCGLDWRERD